MTVVSRHRPGQPTAYLDGLDDLLHDLRQTHADRILKFDHRRSRADSPLSTSLVLCSTDTTSLTYLVAEEGVRQRSVLVHRVVGVEVHRVHQRAVGGEVRLDIEARGDLRQERRGK